MSLVDAWPSNAFQETMLGLSYRPRSHDELDLFSRACVEQFEGHDPEDYGYRLAQVFEPNVLREVAAISGVDHDSLAELRHPDTPAMTTLAERVERADELSVVEAVNTATALISVCRFGPALRLLDRLATRAVSARESFEIWMLRFVIANRVENDSDSARAFLGMRKAIEAGPLPGTRALDACAQAVVWYMKRRVIPEDVFQWYVAKGRELARNHEALGAGSLSAWYRALAMVPAAQGKVGLTRRYMEYTRETAARSIERHPGAYDQHLLKTYYESTLKEHMFVSRDPARAEEAGHALIALDPAWAPSYGELAEAYLLFGRPREAATLYERAVELGPPYYGHHLLQAARAWEQCADDERALTCYRTLSRLVPRDVSVLRAGIEVANRTSAAAHTEFQAMLDRLPPTMDRV